MTLIGVFDSGVGGLSVLGEVRRLLPGADLIYLADQANSPYGQRSLGEVRKLAEACAGHLLDLGAEVVVVACNTASAAALHHLRSIFPDVPFVGMEPAIKPATGLTRSKVVGVLATAATFQSELFSSVLGRFADGVAIVTQACPGWADFVETGEISGPVTEAAIARHLDPVLAAGADTLVLGCTHYPFLRRVIAERAGAQVVIVDPAPAVARQVVVVAGDSNGPGHGGELRLLTTGNAVEAQTVIRHLTGIRTPVTAVTLAEE